MQNVSLPYLFSTRSKISEGEIRGCSDGPCCPASLVRFAKRREGAPSLGRRNEASRRTGVARTLAGRSWRGGALRRSPSREERTPPNFTLKRAAGRSRRQAQPRRPRVNRRCRTESIRCSPQPRCHDTFNKGVTLKSDTPERRRSLPLLRHPSFENRRAGLLPTAVSCSSSTSSRKQRHSEAQESRRQRQKDGRRWDN